MDPLGDALGSTAPRLDSWLLLVDLVGASLALVEVVKRWFDRA
ncbi:MAG: hypothetical protein ACXWNG_02170 [Candidatus Limnocylindrales bacterium]